MIARALGVAAAIALFIAPVAVADDYSNDSYRAFDADNVERTTQRQRYQATTPGYHAAWATTSAEAYLRLASRSVAGLPSERSYITGGAVYPGGNVGDPEDHGQGDRREVQFLNRDGVELTGYVWPCSAGGPCPGVVVTTGSLGVTQAMYGWLARFLQANGYTVFTFDVRGQGESQSTEESPQSQDNFVHGTVDALRFFVSGDNPHVARVDTTRLALIGHSLGATAASVVQQCNSLFAGGDLTSCDGATFAIRAIVAYDSLSAGNPTTPVVPLVPAFDHRADGYFINAQPSPEPPAPDGRVNGAYAKWRQAGVDACTITVRGGTHAEWSDMSYLLSATRYGQAQAAYYTLAWLNLHVRADPSGLTALQAGPIPTEADGAHAPWRASLFSGRFRSACSVGGWEAPDLRSYAGVAAVGDWAGVVAESEQTFPVYGPAS